jgi:heme/copper-type cytochrome/quinol oxidase subunit 2
MFLLLLVGCSSQQFVALPPALNRETAAKQAIEMSAERYKFVPEVLHVKAGTLVTLKITASDGTHGFDLPAFGIDERLEQGVSRTIEFYAEKPGEYGFKCSHICGIGHFGMTGKIVVE